MDNIISKIITNFPSKAEALAKIEALRASGEALVFKGKNISEDDRNFLGSKFWGSLTDKNIYKTFDELLTKLNKIPLLVLTVAIDIPVDKLKGIENFLVETRVDPTLLGGAKLAYGSKEVDYTVLKNMGEILPSFWNERSE